MKDLGPLARPVLLLSCGGYRTGSTYCYNLLGEYVERGDLGRRTGYLEPWHAPLVGQLWSVVEALGAAVGKSHDAPGVSAGAEAWEPLLHAGRLAPVCTVRDWRDVLHSFCRKFGEAPEQVLAGRRWAINQDNLAWWLRHGALQLRYEQLVADPVAALRRVAETAGLPFDEEVAAEAAAASALATAGAITSALGGGDVHARTLLHDDHIATPAGGAWRDWGQERVERLRPALEPLMARSGYEW